LLCTAGLSQRRSLRRLDCARRCRLRRQSSAATSRTSGFALAQYQSMSNRERKMKRIVTCLAVGLLLQAVSLTNALAQPAKVTIGYPPATDFLPVYVAKEKGLFDKRNIDATVTRLPLVTTIPSAIVSGSVQIGMTTIPVLLQAVDGGLDFVIIAGAAHHTKASPFISLLARKEVKITKPEDLVGKKVAVPGINSVIDVMMR